MPPPFFSIIEAQHPNMVLAKMYCEMSPLREVSAYTSQWFTWKEPCIICGSLIYAPHCICARGYRSQRKQNSTFVNTLLASFQLSRNCLKQWVDATWPGLQSSYILFWVAFLLLHLMQPFQLYKPQLLLFHRARSERTCDRKPSSLQWPYAYSW